VHSQRFVDGLLFGRRIADRLFAEEWKAPSTTAKARRSPLERRSCRGSAQAHRLTSG
jgi:hypothetical protein